MQALFEEYNQRYFAEKLPHYSVELVKELGPNIAGEIDKKRRRILLVEDLPEPRRIAILLHEMAHASANIHHGRKWRAEMQRLFAAGAPVDLEDLSSEPPPHERLKIYASAFLGDYPEGTLDQFEQYVLEKMATRFKVVRHSPLRQWPRSLPRAFQEAQESFRLFNEGIFPGEIEYD